MKFFYVGKTCCLRGGDEQRNLNLSQFTRYNNPDRYIYSEHGSKNRNRGFINSMLIIRMFQCLRIMRLETDVFIISTTSCSLSIGILGFHSHTPIPYQWAKSVKHIFLT